MTDGCSSRRDYSRRRHPAAERDRIKHLHAGKPCRRSPISQRHVATSAADHARALPPAIEPGHKGHRRVLVPFRPDETPLRSEESIVTVPSAQMRPATRPGRPEPPHRQFRRAGVPDALTQGRSRRRRGLRDDPVAEYFEPARCVVCPGRAGAGNPRWRGWRHATGHAGLPRCWPRATGSTSRRSIRAGCCCRRKGSCSAPLLSIRRRSGRCRRQRRGGSRIARRNCVRQRGKRSRGTRPPTQLHRRRRQRRRLARIRIAAPSPTPSTRVGVDDAERGPPSPRGGDTGDRPVISEELIDLPPHRGGVIARLAPHGAVQWSANVRSGRAVGGKTSTDRGGEIEVGMTDTTDRAWRSFCRKPAREGLEAKWTSVGEAGTIASTYDEAAHCSIARRPQCQRLAQVGQSYRTRTRRSLRLQRMRGSGLLSDGMVETACDRAARAELLRRAAYSLPTTAVTGAREAGSSRSRCRGPTSSSCATG